MLRNVKLPILYLIIYISLIFIVFPTPSTQATPTLTIQSINCNAGDTVKIPLSLQTNGENIAALHIDIHIDKKIFKVIDVTDGPAATDANKIIISNEFDEDTYRIGFISTDNISNMTDGIIAYLNLSINTSVTPQVISLYVESINGSNSVGNHVDISTRNYTILTNNYPNFTIPSGMYCIIFGSGIINTINVDSGAQVECINFPGNNQINIKENSSNCLIRRSGATVYITGTSNMNIKIPATKTAQTLRFGDGSSTLVIVNDSSGAKVMCGNQEIKTTEETVETPENSGDTSAGMF